MGRRKCIFCKFEGELSNEHIFPQWLLKEFDIYEDMINTVHSAYGIKLSERKHPYNKLVNGLVCENCNNGWMSDLEENAKNSLIILANQEQDYMSVLYENHKHIARWAIKTAMTLNYGTNYRPIIPNRHLHFFYKNLIPAGLRVSVSFMNNLNKEDGDISWFQSQDMLHIKNITSAEDKRKLNNVYRISMRIRHLLIKVIYTPFSTCTYDHDEREILIYPRIEKSTYNIKQINFDDLMSFDLNGVFIDEKQT